MRLALGGSERTLPLRHRSFYWPTLEQLPGVLNPTPPGGSSWACECGPPLDVTKMSQPVIGGNTYRGEHMAKVDGIAQVEMLFRRGNSYEARADAQKLYGQLRERLAACAPSTWSGKDGCQGGGQRFVPTGFSPKKRPPIVVSQNGPNCRAQLIRPHGRLPSSERQDDAMQALYETVPCMAENFALLNAGCPDAGLYDDGESSTAGGAASSGDAASTDEDDSGDGGDGEGSAGGDGGAPSEGDAFMLDEADAQQYEAEASRGVEPAAASASRPSGDGGDMADLPLAHETVLDEDGLPFGDGCWEVNLLLLGGPAAPHQDALVEHYRSTRGGADTILAGPVQIRFAIMLAADVVCVLTCRAHPDKRINELGPVRRALRCGIFFGAVSISQAEAEIVTPRASDFCLFAVTAEEIRRRELRHAEQMEKNGDRWGSGLEATACGPLARVVVRVIRCATVGAALLPPVFTLGAPFDHGGCLRNAPAAAAAKGAPPSKRKRPRGGR